MEGYAASGVATCDCTRHDMKRPNGVCDLQKGERSVFFSCGLQLAERHSRYLNMDFIFLLSILIRLSVIFITVSYDIACQWEKNLPKRCNSPEYEFQVLKGDHKYQLAFFVPKFHLPAHRGECVHTHSFNLRPGVGRTDGEQPERGWAWSNRLAAFTKEMGPGNRRDTIDDAHGDRNWQQTVEQCP